MMTTGDLKNNMRKLISAIKGVDYPGDADIDGLSKGNSAAFLHIYHHAFLEFSRPLAELIIQKDIDLSGKTDTRFMEGAYKTLREIFSYKPPLTQNQFFSSSYAERKVIMCTEILQKIREKHRKLGPKPKPRDPTSSRKLSSSSTRPVSAPAKIVDEFDHVSSLSPAVINEKKSALSPIVEASREKRVTFREKNTDHVEIVYGDAATGGDREPFAAFGMTPGHLHPLTSSPLASQKFDELTKKVSAIEETLLKIVERLSNMEEKLAVKPASPPSANLLDNLTARLTLVENKMDLQEKEKMKNLLNGDHLHQTDNVFPEE
eukprot:GHVO01046614.1.p1 GENE.GHVO01046614.1~~GHVO01046614.1.p1  ORF type:complete len:319 (-),score=47.61 GHVO01046614.1:11-967(-)